MLLLKDANPSDDVMDLEAKLTDAIIVPGLVFLTGSLVFNILEQHQLAESFLLLSFISGTIAFLLHQGNTLKITNKRLIMESGIVVRTSVDIPLMDVKGIEIQQTPIERLIGVGSIIIHATHKSNAIPLLADVYGIRNTIQRMIETSP